MKEQLIPRPLYVNRLLQWKENHLIKVLMGPRRCGKSYVLRLFRQELLHQGVPNSHLITLDLDDFANEQWRDPKQLHEEILGRLQDDAMHYVFIDEVQMAHGFEQVLASLARHDNVDLYVTGSNAYLLSSELATLLTGRYLSLEVLPLSFAEFRSATAADHLSALDDFEQYLRVGTFPALVPYLDNTQIQSVYYSDLITSMIYKDVSQRYKIRDQEVLERLVRTLASSLGSEISTKNLTNALKNERSKISPITIATYLNALASCYFFFRVPRFDVRGKEALRSHEKYYLSDPGLRNHLVATPVRDYGHLLENVVYLELRRRYSEVFVGKTADQEIDFVVRTADGFAYYQVAYSVMDPTTLDRELRAFESLRDGYPRFLLTMDTIGRGRNFDGVKQLNVLDWLLEAP